MKIIVAKRAGFCFGVRRAINLALNLSKKRNNVYTIGPIIHNPQVVRKLEEQGIKMCDNLAEIKNGSVIIRAHGIPKQLLKKIQQKRYHLKIFDATCPFVTKSKKYAQTLAKKNYRVIIIGNPDHPEIKYIISYLPENSIVLNSVSDIKKLVFCKKIGIISQTTQSPKNFIKIASQLLGFSNEFKIFNTICPDAINRQNETVKLAKSCDIILVIGGKNSANTRRLFTISKKIRKETYYVENADEIKNKWLKNVDSAGIVAGASTPDWIIEEVVNRLRRLEIRN
ncbi:MAG: 4-hydroxy-3-methylbut-2-enyl diphosphate reductase [Elusimicrobiota bacterium]